MTDSITAADYVSVVTTTDSLESAEVIAAALVDERLAACVQIDGPIASRYWWEGNVETAQEWRCTIKTRMALLGEVTAAIEGVHPYTVPQILVLPIVEGNEDYLNWIDEVTTRGNAEADGR